MGKHGHKCSCTVCNVLQKAGILGKCDKECCAPKKVVKKVAKKTAKKKKK